MQQAQALAELKNILGQVDDKIEKVTGDMKIIAVPKIGTEVDSFSSDYFNLVDPAVD